MQTDADGMKLYMEDGYEIDEDEILVSSITTGKTLIISQIPPNMEQRKKTGLEKLV